MAYTTAELDAKILQLETAIGGTVEVQFENRRLIYRTMAEIRSGIAYFKSLYATATDAPSNPAPRTRTFFLFGSKGF